MFEIRQNKNSEYYYVLKARNGEIILTGEACYTKAACENDIKSVKKNSHYDERFERITTKNGKHYFRLKATNGQIIGESMIYESVAARENGIESVRRNAYE
jgi:uncharacterized protein YegP (UPF0339 family)